jgi:hypothetical protein
MNTSHIDELAFNLRSEDYFHQKPHHNFFNKIFYSNLWKKITPFTENRDVGILERQRSAEWYGRAPQATWVDGIVDYTYNKHNVSSIGHFHMHENRKNKPNKAQSGGDKTHGQHLYPSYVPVNMPKGCNREIYNYKKCKEDGGSDCTEKKISIVEVCPKWALELLRERKKIEMKATIIDNKTYREALKVEDYNKGRSLRDLKDKYAHLKTIRRDGYWADDRYNPTNYPPADHNSNVNLGDDIIYNDVLGGNYIENTTKKRNDNMGKL